ncbi:MAG: CHAT domain-containing protein [Nostocaceae cyanobacterium]|nr:CHAT domain-containing protein [Nostocaceae cyanobacterium]
MNKTVVINAGSGDLYDGFKQVTVQIRTADNTIVQQFIGSLPAAPNLVQLYRNWQSDYIALCNRYRLRSELEILDIEESATTNVSEVDFDDLCQSLQESINDWLLSKEFSNVSQQLRSHLDPEDEIRVIVETEDDWLQRLPWHSCDFWRDYPYAEMALFRPEYKLPSPAKVPKNKVRILAILGDSQGINVEDEINYLEQLQDAEVTFLDKPSRKELNDKLWDSPWDILFFAGHSATENSTGKMYINENETKNFLTIGELEEALKKAIKNGLQLAIFNSCDGLGLARGLAKLNIPTIITMREPVPNRVAQEFFNYFLDGFAKQLKSLYLAVKETRRKLQGLEDEYPAASWLPVICQNPAVQPPTWVQLGGGVCPYLGLYAFREQDTDLFFGREEFTQNLVTAVRKKPLVAVVGPSGSGKSSVVFAGLVPQLKQDTLTNWQIISFRPGNNPIEALAKAFTPVLSSGDENDQKLATIDFALRLQKDPQALYRVIEKYVQQNPRTRLVLIADQFEELYTLTPQEQRQPFLDALLTACSKTPAFTLVITLRADFYGYALSYRTFSDALQEAVLNLGPMSPQELHSAIVQPAAKIQLGLEEGLTNRIISELGRESGRLPLLEFALTQLWEQRIHGRLTHEAYDKIRGVSLALGEYAEQVYAQLTEDERRIAQQVFIQLVRLGEGAQATRRIATRSQVKNWDLVTLLASKRLVVTNRNSSSGEETVEIVHEALISSWGRLERWLRDNEDFLRWRNRLEGAMIEWENHGKHEDYLLRKAPLVEAEEWWQKRPEEISSSQENFIQKSLQLQETENKKEKRRRQITIYGLSVGFVIALCLAGIAVWNSRKARDSEIQAIARYSQLLFTSNKRLDALIEALRAKQKIQKGVTPKETQTQVESVLRQATYGVIEYNRLSGHESAVNAVAFSPQGTIIASASEDNTVKLWKPDGTFITTLKGHNLEVWGVAFSPDGQIIASASKDNTVKLWKPDGTLITTFNGHNSEVNAVAFSPDGQIIASASDDKTVKLWKPDGTLITTFNGHDSGVNAVVFSPDGQYLASASNDNTVKLWKLDGTFITTFKGHNSEVNELAFSPDGQTLASASSDKTVKLWNLDGTLITTFNGHTDKVYGIAFSPDGKTLASASGDQTLKLWNLKGNLLKTFDGHTGRVYGIAFSPDGKTIASASRDRTVKLWKIKDTLLTTLYGHREQVSSVAFSPDGKTLASSSADKTVKLWDLKGNLLNTFNGHSDDIYAIVFSPDGQTLASASRDNSVKLWNRDGTLLNTFSNHEDWVTGVAFSPDGKTLASSSADKKVKLWNRDGTLIKTLKHNDAKFWGVAFSRYGKIIASASSDNTVKLWNRNGSLLSILDSHTDDVTGVAFSPDGRMIASASSDKTVKLWKLQTDNKPVLLATLDKHSDVISKVAFSPNGKMISSSTIDNTIKLWKLEPGKQPVLMYTLNDGGNGISEIAFSPHGKMIASASSDKTVILWDLNRVLNINNLMVYGCNFIGDYLKTNPNVNKQDKGLCDGVKSN